MKVTNHSNVPVYTISGSDTSRPLPDWLIRKRKRSLKQDPEYANRIELLQDFGFEEASHCVRASEDGDWVMSTGTYKPQIHTHYLPHLSLSFARHTNTINQTFLLLSSDYSKSLHLQTDRFLEFHTPGGLHYSTRIPRYGRDLKYDRRSTEALIPAVGVNAEGMGEVYRLNLELGRFMKGYEIDVGGDDFTSAGGGALQGGINTGSVNVAAVAEESHNLNAFGTSLGTVEFWDPRSRSRVGVLAPPPDVGFSDSRVETTALQFDRSGLNLATGTSNGLIHLYDLRSPVPLLKKDQGFGLPIQDIIFLSPTTTTRQQTSEPKILTSDKRIIKIWDPRDGKPWTHVEPAVDLHHVEWCKDSGMLLTANEGKQQHSFFIPQLGPAPKWCAFLDNVVEEMAEDPDDPNAFGPSHKAGDVYDNYKFLTAKELDQLNMSHLVGTTSLLRPYMHGYFVAQKLYEEARLISQPELWHEQRAKSIQARIEKERESRIRGNKKVQVKVNRRLAEKMLEREEKNERRKARRVLAQGGDDDVVQQQQQEQAQKATTAADGEEEGEEDNKPVGKRLLSDSRFSRLFQDEDFEVDETSREFASINPSTKVSKPSGLTAVEEEALAEHRGSSDSDSSGSESEDESARRGGAKKGRAAAAAPPDEARDTGRISTSSYKKSGHRPMQMVVSSSSKKPGQGKNNRDKSFGARASGLKEKRGRQEQGGRSTDVVGEREITFVPAKKERPQRRQQEMDEGDEGRSFKRKERRSASGNTFRKM
ncbi:uncharacterized protein K452DRAFT_317162 [Aplosporella prunicola CBS 121167]|uniref:Uncharacterized protein n=1 Tax=Aplosporella prunicola CBS 121167 TaxID=1176127 RepID=A0A6A6BJB1_9PEZI|nr:uncharacterized protein K452DRAFT_317162 [Aplosporella prunicola CBS 121167]KAF2143708.1 hypothetical protein K452DRAFT_317162 [Aplosporella prunicola CBS 121167]